MCIFVFFYDICVNLWQKVYITKNSKKGVKWGQKGCKMDYNTILKNDINVLKDKNHNLRVSAYDGHYNIAKLLLENGANNDYALRFSAYYGCYDFVKLFLKYGANIHSGNDDALIWSANNGYYNIVKLLLDNGANVKANNYQALRWAKAEGHTNIIKLLEEHISKIENGL